VLFLDIIKIFNGGYNMEFKIRKMEKNDWNNVLDIYMQGINTKKATFQTEAPEYNDWDNGHIKIGRLVAVDTDDKVIGWIALSQTSSRYVYRGVVEVSIYISESCRKNNVGYELINRAIEESEKENIWTLQSGIFSINKASIALHKKCGFRIVGIREKIGCDSDGIWQDTVLMERRSKIAGI
jgi:phosphinothricin acetyltransferase